MVSLQAPPPPLLGCVGKNTLSKFSEVDGQILFCMKRTIVLSAELKETNIFFLPSGMG